MTARLFLTGLGTAAVIGLAAIAIKRGGGMLRGAVDDDDDDDDDWGSDAYMRRIDAKRAARVARVEEALATSPAIIVNNGYSDELILVSGEMQDRESGAFRATTFSDDGPRGHSTRKTMTDIAKEIAEARYKTIRPASEAEVMAWTSTEKFITGSKKVAAMQARNTLYFRANDRDAARTVEDRADKLAAEGKWDDAVLVLQQGIKDLGRIRLI